MVNRFTDYRRIIIRLHISYRGLQAGGEQERGGGLGDPPQPWAVPPLHQGVGRGQGVPGPGPDPQQAPADLHRPGPGLPHVGGRGRGRERLQGGSQVYIFWD